MGRYGDQRVRRDQRHKCAARGCTAQVSIRLLMCVQHWRLVPADVKTRVWRAFAGRGYEPLAPVDQDYANAITDAINAVAMLEARIGAQPTQDESE